MELVVDSGGEHIVPLGGNTVTLKHREKKRSRKHTNERRRDEKRGTVNDIPKR